MTAYQNLHNVLVHACSLAGIGGCLIGRYIPLVDHHGFDEPVILGWLVVLGGVEIHLEVFEMVAR